MNADLMDIIAIMRLDDRDVMTRRIRSVGIETRSELAIVADLALVLPGPFDGERHGRQLFALAVALATPLAIDPHSASCPDASAVTRDRLHRLTHWLVLGLCHRIPVEPPPVHHADLPWLTQVVSAHASQPWIPRLLAAMAAAA